MSDSQLIIGSSQPMDLKAHEQSLIAQSGGAGAGAGDAGDLAAAIFTLPFGGAVGAVATFLTGCEGGGNKNNSAAGPKKESMFLDGLGKEPYGVRGSLFVGGRDHSKPRSVPLVPADRKKVAGLRERASIAGESVTSPVSGVLQIKEPWKLAREIDVTRRALRDPYADKVRLDVDAHRNVSPATQRAQRNPHLIKPPVAPLAAFGPPTSKEQSGTAA